MLYTLLCGEGVHANVRGCLAFTGDSSKRGNSLCVCRRRIDSSVVHRERPELEMWWRQYGTAGR